MYPDRAMRLRHKKSNHSFTLAGLVAVAALIITWCLATIQPIPAQSCSMQTFDGNQYGSFNYCGE